MPQLELFLIGDQFMVVLCLYLGFFLMLLFVESFLLYKLTVYNIFHDGLSLDIIRGVKI